MASSDLLIPLECEGVARPRFALATLSGASAEAASPIGKVLQLISDLQTKIIGEGEKSQKAQCS